MANEDVRAKLKAFAARPAAPPAEALAKFLRTYFSDAEDLGKVRRDLARMIALNPRSVQQGLEAIEGVLAEPPPPGMLAMAVAHEGNWVLDDPSDAGATVWLREIAAMVRGLLRDAGVQIRP
jgi:hypothetical protein